MFTLFLVAAYSVNLMIAPVSSGVSWGYFIPSLLLFALLCGGAVGAPEGVEFFGNPLVASFCLIFPLWLARFGSRHELVAGIGALVALASVLGLTSSFWCGPASRALHKYIAFLSGNPHRGGSHH